MKALEVSPLACIPGMIATSLAENQFNLKKDGARIPNAAKTRDSPTLTLAARCPGQRYDQELAWKLAGRC